MGNTVDCNSGVIPVPSEDGESLTLYIGGRDAAGNSGVAQVASTFTYDNTAPTVAFSSSTSPAGGAFNSTSWATLSPTISCTDTNNCDTSSCKYSYSTDVYASMNALDTCGTMIPAPSDGANKTLYIGGRDAVGNAGAAQTASAFIYDNTPPSLVSVGATGPQNDGYYGVGTPLPALAVECTDATVGCDATTCAFSIDGKVNWIACASFAATISSDDTYNLWVRENDTLGNGLTASVSAVTFTYDNTPGAIGDECSESNVCTEGIDCGTDNTCGGAGATCSTDEECNFDLDLECGPSNTCSVIGQSGDVIPPTATATAENGYTNNTWSASNVVINFTCSDTGLGCDGVNQVHYKVDNGAEQTGASVTISTEGAHTLEYWGVDTATPANTETHHTTEWNSIKIDKTAPTASISSITADSSTGLTVVAETADTGGSGISSYQLERDGAELGWSDSLVNTGLTPNTQYVYRIQAKDIAGNTSSYSQEVSTYTLANIPVSLAAVVNSNTQITVSWQANSNPDGTEYNIVRVIPTQASSGWITDTSYAFTDLSCNTSYSFQVQARNGAGTPQETNFTSTVTATTSACTGGGEGGGGGGNTYNPPVSLPQEEPVQPVPTPAPSALEGSFNTTISSGLAKTNNPIVKVSLNGGSDAVQMQISTDSNFQGAIVEPYQNTKSFVLPSGDGEKKIYVRFIGKDGEVSRTISDSIILDTQAPEIKLDNIQELFGPDDNIILSGTINTTGNIIFHWDDNYGIVKITSPGNWQAELGKTSFGTHTVYIKAEDDAGNSKATTAIVSVRQKELLVPAKLPSATTPFAYAQSFMSKLKDQVNSIIGLVNDNVAPLRMVKIVKQPYRVFEGNWSLLQVASIKNAQN